MQVDLHQCIALLNLIDSEFEKIIERGKETLFLSNESNTNTVATTSGKNTATQVSEIEDARDLMLFSIHLLRNSVNKDVYNSTEVRIHLHNEVETAYRQLSFNVL